MFTKPSMEESGCRFPLFFLLMLLATAAGCTRTEVSGTVVARVNDNVLTLESIKEHVDPSQPLSENEIQQYANRWIINELLFQEAQRRGYDESENIQRKMEDALKQLTIAELLEKEVYSIAENSIRPSEIAAYYQSNNPDFILRENIARLSIAVFKGLEKANRFRTKVISDNNWSKNAAEFGADANAELISLTDSIFYSQSTLYPPELWKVASAMGLYDVSFPVKTSVGYVVIQSLGQYKAGTNAPLSYVEPQIRNRLTMDRRQQRYQTFLQSLRAKHAVQLVMAPQDSTTIGRE